ncbi:uncharacterized protein [Drosophila pseudoobscura]|uniref:Uncharacterized protein n=1 Tax=Drosophila pseudoobscura pseudoobscura TaxID=46245 RepID=A0A6I8VBJ6_DROPS|nr:uncharacterized protein LOC4802334 [Drosophila pseudoobscura]XP_015037756.2 uncharacterized protein LOC4802334 [Drosophila pseudoobscura]
METTAMVPRAPARMMTPEELVLQSLTKQIFKSRLFRGYYLGRYFVEQIGDYRDVIALQRSERELEKLLIRDAGQLQMFYQRCVPNMWVGISYGSLGNYKHIPHPAQLETCIWAELNDLALGEYWFSIKTLRFRDQEVLLKLKTVRAVEPEPMATPRRSVSINRTTASNTITAAGESSTTEIQVTDQPPPLGLADFLEVLRQWGEGIKQATYDFMANDVNKHNIMGTIRFLGLLLFSIGGGAIAALRFLGIFAVRFLFELSRLSHTLTPILLQILQFLNNIVGGVFILFTMIWKDIITRGQPPTPKQPLEASTRFKSITYDRSDRRRWR